MAMTSGASALVTLMERIAHEVGMSYVGAPARDPRGARHGPAVVCLQCGTVEVCVIFLDTLTPEFELYVRLRERRH
ncbi:hypothetical protein Taro_047166 [Colocasia esculenta]|uniref:Uncharacterized protein n=1 Tax=Colocasia esculenta TaxID=4460 RepID=A0A843X6W1_COLES|nr:hypothetical protein [Colocasia esculenta]